MGQIPGPQIKIRQEPIMSVGNKGQNYKRPNRDQSRKKTNEQRNTNSEQIRNNARDVEKHSARDI